MKKFFFIINGLNVNEDLKGIISSISKLGQKFKGLGIDKNDTVFLLIESDIFFLNDFLSSLNKFFFSNNIKYFFDEVDFKFNIDGFTWIKEKDFFNNVEINSYLNFLIKLTEGAHCLLSEVMRELLINTIKRKDLYKLSEFNNFLKMLPSRYIPETLISKGDFYNFLSYTPSFSSSLSEHTLHRKVFSSINSFSVEGLVDDKNKAIEFVKLMGIKAPEVFQNNVDLSDLVIKENIVVKPVGGHSSNDVFIIKKNNVFSVEHRKIINLDSFYDKVSRSKYKKWITEEYIFGDEGYVVPWDIKVFSFYGEIPLISVIDRNDNKVRYDWLDGDFNRVDTGRLRNSLFKSGFRDERVLNLAKNISLNIPTPFMRIDFLFSGKEIFFGEVTPRPGNFHAYNFDYDSELGSCFVNAEARLFSDLYNGKKFNVFKNFFFEK